MRFGDFSRRIFAPSPDGSFRQSKWYYERTRGQYHDELSLLSGAEKRKFDLEFPKSQLIGKTDLAKFLNVWRGLPDIVSKGAQKNFSNFAEMIEQKWRDSQNDINEDFYRQSIAKAIVFRSAERIVTVQPWYQGGYRANIVAYAIAKIGYDCEQFGEFVDFASIWRSQSISASMEAALKVVSQEVHRILISPNSGVSNVTEWAKMQACWSQVKALRVDYPTSWRRTLLDKHQVMASKRAAVKDQKIRVFRHFSG